MITEKKAKELLAFLVASALKREGYRATSIVIRDKTDPDDKGEEMCGKHCIPCFDL